MPPSVGIYGQNTFLLYQPADFSVAAGND